MRKALTCASLLLAAGRAAGAGQTAARPPAPAVTLIPAVGPAAANFAGAADVRGLLDAAKPVAAGLDEIASIPAGQAHQAGASIMDRVLGSRSQTSSEGAEPPAAWPETPPAKPAEAAPRLERGQENRRPEAPPPPRKPSGPEPGRRLKLSPWMKGLLICSLGLALVGSAAAWAEHLPILWAASLNAALGALGFALLAAPRRGPTGGVPSDLLINLEKLLKVCGFSASVRLAPPDSVHVVPSDPSQAQAVASLLETYLQANQPLARWLLERRLSIFVAAAAAPASK